MTVQSECDLSELLRFICGIGHPYGEGISSYADSDANQVAIHKLCLELERRGLICRHHRGKYSIVWKPTDEGKKRAREL